MTLQPKNHKAILRVVSYREIDIKTARCENNLTLREVCRRTGIDPANYSKYERGLLPMTEEIFNKINTALTLNR